MSNFNLIDQTKNTVTGSDLLVAGSIVGSFLFFVIKSQKNKVVVLHKKNKSKTQEKPAITQDENPITSENTINSQINISKFKSSLPLKSKFPIKTYLFNPMTLEAFKGKTNAFDLMKEPKDVQDFMSLIPKPKQFPIERLLLSENELEELREIANHKKKERFSYGRIRTEGNPEESEDKWSIREYDAQDFDLENVYDDFLDNQKRRILHKHKRKNSSSSRNLKTSSFHEEKAKKSKNPMYETPFVNNANENEAENEEILINFENEEENKHNEKYSSVAKKTSTFEIESPETQAILKRYEEAAKKLIENSFKFKKNTFISRKEAEQRAVLITNLNMNCLMNFSENGDSLTSLKLTFNLKTSLLRKSGSKTRFFCQQNI